jgi:thioredoxin reductase (NADPH)
MHKNVKYWILPDIENRIRNGEVTAYFETTVREIRERTVVLETHGRQFEIANDFVFALTGYHPDFDFLRSLGIQITGNDCRPYCNTESLESNVGGIYLAGVIVAGARTSEIFIENGRFHGRQIAADLARKLTPQTVST